jgi:hypothetical protein
MNGMYAEKRTKTGAIVSGIVALLAVAGLTMAFLNTASPYVTRPRHGKLRGTACTWPATW